MSYNDNDAPATKVAIRGKMLIAWLSESTPPVLWRWVIGDVSGGFGLRNVDGRVDLVSFDANLNSQVVASFSSASSAERALARLSRALFSYQTPAKRITKVLVVLVIAFSLLQVARVLQSYSIMASSAQKIQAMRANAGAAASAQPTPPKPLALPGLEPPATPPMGTPTDVDKFYH